MGEIKSTIAQEGFKYKMKLQVIRWYAFQRVKESDLHISLFDSGYIKVPTYGDYN